jgi:urocanate hydratase
MVGVARRAWATNPNAMETVRAFHREHGNTDRITLPYLAAEDAVETLVGKSEKEPAG